MNMISKLHFSTPKLFITFQGSKLIAMNMNRVVKLLTDPHSVSIYQLLGIGPKNHLLENLFRLIIDSTNETYSIYPADTQP